MSFDGDELRALARKYHALVALRARRDGARPGGHARLEELRDLAREFPGCLRELDTLGATELARRAAAVENAASGSAHEEWMAWIWGYHRLMRAALALRRGAGDGVGADSADEAFAVAVKAPPSGRLGIVVLRRLAAEHGRPAKEIAAALFPLRRPSPYEL